MSEEKRKEVKGEARMGAPSGLLVLTGASHTGKSSVARSLLNFISPPAALVGVDQVLENTLVHPPGDRWREIPLAYDLLLPQVDVLLSREWFVVLESTFTFVPGAGKPEIHLHHLNSFLGLAERLASPAQVVQLVSDRQTVDRRAAETGRLEPTIVATTHELHEAADLPAATLKICVDKEGPDELARRILGCLGTL